MKMHFKNYLWILLLVVFSCEKGTIDMQTTEIGIDPVGNKDALNRSLQLRGHFEEGDIPVVDKTAPLTFGLNIPIDTVNIGDETKAFIPFNVPDMGFFTLCSVNMKVIGASGHWKVAAVNDTGSADYFIELVVPKIVREGKIKIAMNAEVCFSNRRFVTANDTVVLDIRPSIPCGTRLFGSTGLTIRKFDLGNTKGKVKVSLSTGNIPDRMDIKYGGKYVLSTCTPFLKPGRYPKCSNPAECFLITKIDSIRNYYFDYDPAKSKLVELYMLGFCGQTRNVWAISIDCPKP